MKHIITIVFLITFKPNSLFSQHRLSDSLQLLISADTIKFFHLKMGCFYNEQNQITVIKTGAAKYQVIYLGDESTLRKSTISKKHLVNFATYFEKNMEKEYSGFSTNTTVFLLHSNFGAASYSFGSHNHGNQIKKMKRLLKI